MDRKTAYALSLPLGLGTGIALGTSLMAAKDNPAFLGMGIGIGVALSAGLSVAFTRGTRSDKDTNTKDEAQRFKG